MLVLCFYSGQLICVRVSFFVLMAFSLYYYLVVSTSAIDCMERLVPEMIYYVSSGTLNPTHSLTLFCVTCSHDLSEPHKSCYVLPQGSVLLGHYTTLLISSLSHNYHLY